MSCAFDKERLTAFFDGELDAAERAQTERHVSECSECLRDLGEIKSAALAVKTLPRPRAPRSIAEGVALEIAAAGRVKRIDVWRRRVLWGVAAAAGVLIALNVSFFTNPPRESLARNAPAAPAVGVLHDAKESERNAVEKSYADGADKRRSLDGKGVGLKAEAPAEDRAPAPEGVNRLRQEEAKKAAPRPDAKPGAAAPAPAAPPAPAATPPPAEAPRAKLAAADEKKDKAADLGKQAGDPAAPAKAKSAAAAPLAVVPAYTVRGGKADLLRARAEALALKWTEGAAARKAPVVASGGARPGGSGSAFGGPAPLVLELTPEQFEELKAELAKAGATLEAGAPELRGARTAAPAPEALKETAEKDALESGRELKKRRITLHFAEPNPK